MLSAGRPSPYVQRKNYTMSLEYELFDKAKAKATSEGRNLNEVIQDYLRTYVNDESLNLPPNIEQRDAAYYCTKCDETMLHKHQVLVHKCLNIFESIATEEPQVVD